MRVGAGLALAAAPLLAQTPPGPLPEEGRYVGRPVPELAIEDVRGGSLRLAGNGQAKPVLLALVFTRCAGLCSPFLSSLLRAEDELGGRGADYRTVVVSFDARDSPDDMRELAARLGLRDASDWTFGIAAPADVRRLAEAVGFWYAWDAEREQFDHPGLLVAVERGRVVRLLLGTQIEPVRLHEVLRELSGEFVASYPLPGRVAFRCFQYRADTGELRLDWGFLILLVPALLAGAGTLAIFHWGGRLRTAAG